MCSNTRIQADTLNNVLRIQTRYANLDTIEEDYGINLLPLATFAMDKYAGDPCEQFKPKGDEVLSDKDFNMIAKMHKAISIMQWKMEGQIIKRRPEFRMENRLLLDKIDFEKGTVEPLSFDENECEKILSMSMSPDGRKILLLGVKKDYLQLLSYDVQNQQIDADTTWQSEPTSNPENAFLAENSDGSQVAVYDGNAECYLIETAHLKQKQVVDIENAKNLQLSFFENDQFLLGADSECIWLYDLDKHQVVSSYAVSMRSHAMQLTADISGSYFTLKEIWVTENIRQDEGMSKQNCHIYFVDESHQIYPYADVAFGYRLPDEEMVYQFNSDGYAEHPLYTFADLYKKAQKE